MSYETILVSIEDRVATITLNRPERMNAWSAQLAAEVSAAMRAANEDDGVRAIVLTGAGRAFCAGQDLAEAVAREGRGVVDFAEHLRRTYNPIVRAIRAMPKPVVCGGGSPARTHTRV